MKRKKRFVSPMVTRAVPLFPESDMMVLATSIDSSMNISTMGQIEENHNVADENAYTVELY